MKYQLTQEDLAALRSYSEEHGKSWKSKLSDDWFFARAKGDRGVILHRLRNKLGPTWLLNFNFPVDA